MAEYYGTIQGSRGVANRCGTRTSGITASARSWHGSITVELHADGATIRVADGSHVGGRTLWSGLLSELLKAESLGIVLKAD